MPDRQPEPWETNERTAAEQRQLLAATIRFVAHWRYEKAHEFDDPIARKRSLRAEVALRTLANFVGEMPDDDKDLTLKALRNVEESGDKLILTPECFDMLSRFGLSQSSWSEGGPTEAQMRNVLRRVDGCEARERAAEKRGMGGA
jgi:hypothetical protein